MPIHDPVRAHLRVLCVRHEVCGIRSDQSDATLLRLRAVTLLACPGEAGVRRSAFMNALCVLGFLLFLSWLATRQPERERMRCLALHGQWVYLNGEYRCLP